MRKRILALVLCCCMAIGVSGCGDTAKETATTKETTTKSTATEEDGTVESEKDVKKSLEAFKEFYSEFYEEHRDRELVNNGGEIMDCPARIIMDDSGSPLMAICDFVVLNETEWQYDIYLFEYDGKEVAEKAKIENAKWDTDDGFTINCIEGEIFIGNIDGHYAYKLQDDKFVLLDTVYENKKTGEEVKGHYYQDSEYTLKGFATGLDSDGLGASYLVYGEERGYNYNHEYLYDNIWCESFFLRGYRNNGDKFESLIDKMLVADIKNDIDLKIFYAQDYIDAGLFDERSVVTVGSPDKSSIDKSKAGALLWQAGVYYMLYEDGTAAVLYGREDPVEHDVDFCSFLALLDYKLQVAYGTLEKEDVDPGFDSNILNGDFWVEIKAGEGERCQIDIHGIEDEKAREFITEYTKEEYTSSGGLNFKKDLDGSGIIQESYYAVFSKRSSTVFISGAGKSLEELMSDTENDGIYKICSIICKEYRCLYSWEFLPDGKTVKISEVY